MIDIHALDLEFMGVPRLIGSFLVPCPEGGFVVLETGPASTLETLERRIEESGFELEELKGIFVTHVHLDHAGGSGSLAVRAAAPVFVHPLGARHLIDPSEKLLPSAQRLYGDMMIPMWGVVEPVPKELIVVVEDGDTVELEGLDIVAHHTPGHAVHHIAWQVGGAVATGDVGGIRFPGATLVLPPLPPPDIDIDHWCESIERLRALEPDMLLLTHFGIFEDVERHLRELEGRLLDWRADGEEVVNDGGGAVEIASALDAAVSTAFPEDVSDSLRERYRRICPAELNAAGLERSLRRSRGA